jgi:holo-ACP synthase CitX
LNGQFSLEDNILEPLLAAREERAWAQKFFLSSFASSGVCCIVQFSLNIPGWPKRLSGDERAVSAAIKIFMDEIACSASPLASAFLSNAAGFAALFSLSGEASEIKKTAVSIEESFEWGRALDIDVITDAGPVSRTREGFPARRCLVCGEEAKICARSKAHPMEELRRKTESILLSAPNFLGG